MMEGKASKPCNCPTHTRVTQFFERSTIYEFGWLRGETKTVPIVKREDPDLANTLGNSAAIAALSRVFAPYDHPQRCSRSDLSGLNIVLVA